MSTPFGPTFGRRRDFSIPGAGTDPTTGTPQPRWVFAEMWDIIPSIQKPAPKPVEGPLLPGQERPVREAPGEQAQPPPEPDLLAPEVPGMNFLSMEEMLAGTEQAWDQYMGTPFARQKRALTAIGDGEIGIRQLDSIFENLMMQPEQKRIKMFKAQVPYFEAIGLSPGELEDLQRHLRIFGVPEVKDRTMLTQFAMDAVAAPFKALRFGLEEVGKSEMERAADARRAGEVIDHMVVNPKTTLAAFKIFGKGLVKLPKQYATSQLASAQGWRGASVVDPGRVDRWIASANRDIEKFARETAEQHDNGQLFPGMPLETIATLPQALGFSLAATIPAAGAAVGVAALPVPGARPAGVVTGAVVSGVLAFNMASYQFMQMYLELKNEESIQLRGKPIDKQEEDALKKDFAFRAQKFGLWEALPEAVGNLVLFSAVKSAVVAMKLGKSTTAKLIQKVGAVYFSEFATETVTQQLQASELHKAGMPGGREVDWTSPTDWLKALGEIAPQTFAVVTVTAGAGATMVAANHQIQMLRQEIGEDAPLFKGMVQKIQQNAVEKGKQIKAAVTTPAYEKYMYPQMHKLSDAEKTNIVNRDRGAEPIMGLEYYKDMIRSRNWEGVFEEASMGRFPSLDELGSEWLSNELSEAKEGATETEKLTIESIMSFAVSHPAANWYRAGTPTNHITQRMAQDWRRRYGRQFQNISADAKAPMMAPEEASPEAAQDPRNRRNIVLFNVKNRTLTNHASPGFIEFSRSKHFLPLSLSRAYAAYTQENTVGRPMTRPEFNGFIDSLIESDIAEQLPVGFDPESALNYSQERLLATEDIDLRAIQLALENGGLFIMLPKDPRGVNYIFNRVRPAPTAAQVAEPVTPPPAGQPALVEADEAVAASVPDSQIAAAAVGANELAVKTGYTPDEVVFMKTMGMTEEAIEAKATEEHFMDPELLAPPKTGDRVVIPVYAHQEGTLVDDTNPASMQIQFDNGMRAGVPENQIFHAKALNFGEEIAPAPDSVMSNGEKLFYDLLEARQATDETKAEHPQVVAELEGVDEARRVMAAKKAAKVAESKRRQAAAAQVKPSDDSIPKLLEELGEELEEAFGQMMEEAAPQPQEIGRRILDPATEGMIEEATEVVDRVGYTSYGMLKDIFAVPVERAKNLFAEMRNRGIIDREGNAAEPGAKPVPGTQQALRFDETPPSEWTLDDGTPLWQVPLEEYLLQGRPEELQRIRNMRVANIGFNAAATREADLYVKRVGDVVKEYLPDDQEVFNELEAAHQRHPGSVPQMKFDQLLSKRHDLYARIRFAREMEATGEVDPGDAAMAVHRNAVRQALNEGKEVPDDVMDHYPDMKRILTETAPLTTTPVKILNDELKSRGYTASQVGRMNPQSKEWVVANDIDPTTVSVLENGQVVELHPQDRPINNPKAFDGIEKPQAQADLFNEEMSVVDRIVSMIQENDPEAGFFRVPGGQAILRMKVFSSRIAERLRNARIAKDADLVRSLEGSIDKWAAEHKLAELYGEWALMNNKKIIRRGLIEAAKTKEERFKTPEAELEMVTRYMDDPDFHQADYQKLSAPAKQLVTALQDSFQELWSVAHSFGLLDQWRANYIYRLYKNDARKINRVQYSVTNKKIAADPVFGKKRKYEHIKDAEAAGLDPVLDPIALHRAYVVELGRTIANANLINALMGLETENGLPAVMARPKPNDPLLNVYVRDYVPLPIKGLERWVYKRKIGDKPGFIKVEARATPLVAKRLGEVFKVLEPPGRLFRAFLSLKAFVMRLKLINPAIHGANIQSDYADEFNFNISAMIRGTRRAKKLFIDQDNLVVTAVRQGLNLQLAHSTSNEMRRAMIRQSEILHELSKPYKIATWPVRVLLDASDKALWGYVRNVQLSMWEMMRDRFMRHNPEWSSEKAGRTAAVYVNTNLGTMPSHWMKPWAKRMGSIFLFARNWTFSNITMFAEAVSRGRWGLGLGGLETDSRREIGRHFGHHLIKGMVMLFVGLQVAQMAWQALTNLMKDLGLIHGAKVKVRPTFMNESKRHYFDVWIGRNKRGQNLYMTPHYFRYIRDYVGYATDPFQTSVNKMDIFVRAAGEIMINYQSWTEQPIIPRGAETADKLKLGLVYFAETMLPMNYYAKRPGRKPTKKEWIVPFTGTWIRRGTPGGKMGKLYYEYRDWMKFQQDKLDNKIDEAIQDMDWEQFAELAAQRYTSSEAKANRIIKFIAPTWYLTRVASAKELIQFDMWLKKRGESVFRKTYSVADLATGIQWELADLAAKQAANFKEETPTDDARKEVIRRLEQFRVPDAGLRYDEPTDTVVPKTLKLEDVLKPLEEQPIQP